jgi:hypothetical protein
MAYREVEMWEILEVLRQVHRGQPQRAIQRVSGHSRTTIRRYVRTAQRLGWAPEREPDEALAGAVAQRLKPVASDPEPGESEAKLAPHQARIQAWLSSESERGLRLSKVHMLLRREGVDVPYSSLHRFAVRHCGFADARRVTVRVADVAPGELAEVDFGRLCLVWDAQSGRRRVAHALLVPGSWSWKRHPLQAGRGSPHHGGAPIEPLRPRVWRCSLAWSVALWRSGAIVPCTRAFQRCTTSLRLPASTSWMVILAV